MLLLDIGVGADGGESWKGTSNHADHPAVALFPSTELQHAVEMGGTWVNFYHVTNGWLGKYCYNSLTYFWVESKGVVTLESNLSHTLLDFLITASWRHSFCFPNFDHSLMIHFSVELNEKNKPITLLTTIPFLPSPALQSNTLTMSFQLKHGHASDQAERWWIPHCKYFKCSQLEKQIMRQLKWPILNKTRWNVTCGLYQDVPLQHDNKTRSGAL